MIVLAGCGGESRGIAEIHKYDHSFPLRGKAPKEDETQVAYTDLLFDICQQFGIRYYSTTPKEKAFVEEVTRVTWAKEQESLTGIKQDIRPAFSA